MKKFSSEIINAIKYYVYIYSDPDTGEIFYVGKGKGNRCFSHIDNVDDHTNKKFASKIKEIQSVGKVPKIEILVHGLDDETSKRVEASVIDLIGLKKLTNKVGGYNSSKYGRMSLEQISSLYVQKQVDRKDINEKVLLISINKSFRYSMTPIELYDVTRGIWRIGEEARNNAEYAFAVYDGIVQEVYKIHTWFPAGETFTTKQDFMDGYNDKSRWEFVGKVAEDSVRKKYINSNVSSVRVKHDSSPLVYVNI
jgi:hypothetical protein